MLMKFWVIKKMFIVLLSSIANASNQTNCVLLSNQNVLFNLPLFIYILMNAVKNFTIIPSELN